MEKEKKKKIAVIVIIACVVFFLIVTIVVLAFLLLRKEAPVAREDGARTYVIDGENYQQIMDEMESQVKEGYFETYMNFTWTFPDGASESTDAVLGNSPNNSKPIRCEVLLADSREVIFTTSVIPVGAELPAIKLDVELEAGKYDAVCMVYLLDDMGDGTYKDYSSAGFNVTIMVKN